MEVEDSPRRDLFSTSPTTSAQAHPLPYRIDTALYLPSFDFRAAFRKTIQGLDMLGAHNPQCKRRNTTPFPYAKRTYSQIGKQVGKAQKRNQPTAENHILVTVQLEMTDNQAETLRHQHVRNTNGDSFNTHKSHPGEEPKLAMLPTVGIFRCIGLHTKSQSSPSGWQLTTAWKDQRGNMTGG